MKLYYSPGACSLGVRIVINELKLPAQFERVDLKTKQTETGKNFLTINPKGAVAAFELDSGEILTENAVIMQYLADHAKGGTVLLPIVADLNRYHVLSWLNYVCTEVHKNFGPLFNASFDAGIKEKFIAILITKFNFLDKHLQDQDFLMGKSFTLPDAYLFVMITWAEKNNLAIGDLGNLQRYYRMLKGRPSISDSLAQEKTV